jgi:hypothetical protein
VNGIQSVIHLLRAADSANVYWGILYPSQSEISQASSRTGRVLTRAGAGKHDMIDSACAGRHTFLSNHNSNPMGFRQSHRQPETAWARIVFFLPENGGPP